MNWEAFKVVVDYVLAFLGTVLIWPVAVLVLGVYFFRNHRTDISLLMGRIHVAKFAGAELRLGTPPPQLPANAVPEVLADQIIRSLPEPVRQLLHKLLKDNEFERLYNLIFGSQWRLLDYLNLTLKPETLSAVQLFFYSDVTARGIPLELLPWLNFLRNTGLVEDVPDREPKELQITPKGREFVAHIKGTYPAGIPRRIY
jgi:hypothetical protein